LAGLLLWQMFATWVQQTSLQGSIYSVLNQGVTQLIRIRMGKL